MKLTKQKLKTIIKEELAAVLNESEQMNPSHPDYEMLGSLITKVFMDVMMGVDIKDAMVKSRVPPEHYDYVADRVANLQQMK